MDGNAVLAGLLVGTVGLGVFVYGKRATRLPHLVAGLLLMVFPYFLSSAWAVVGIGALISLLLFLAVKLGL